MVSVITARVVRWMGLLHSPKTNGDHLIKDNLGHSIIPTAREEGEVVSVAYQTLTTMTQPVDWPLDLLFGYCRGS